METNKERGKATSENHRCTDIHQEQEQNNNNKETAFEQTVLHIINRAVNKAALTEYVGRNVHISRQVLLQVRHNRV